MSDLQAEILIDFALHLCKSLVFIVEQVDPKEHREHQKGTKFEINI